MSTDAFAAALGKGASFAKPRVIEALRIGVIFGVVEAITPVIGWAIGAAASNLVTSWDHWIAFVLLLGLGVRMIIAGFGTPKEEKDTPNQSIVVLAVTAIATSVDAMAVGVGLAFVDVNIVAAAAAIGLATCAMVTIGVMVGHSVGKVVGQRAEAFGGLILIFVGSVILYEHLSGAAA